MAQPTQGSTGITGTNVFGSQITAGLPSPAFGTHSQRTPNVFGTFGDQNSQVSNTFGSFVGQTSQPPSTFGSVSATGTTSSGFSSSQVFGTSGSPAFGASTPAPVFGSQPSSSAPPSYSTTSTANVFGAPLAFGTSERSRGQVSTMSMTSQNFGAPGLVANPFGSTGSTTTSSSLFGSVSQPSPAFSTSAFPTSAPFGSSSFGSSQHVFSSKSQPQQGSSGGLRFASSSAGNQGFSSQSSKLFNSSAASTTGTSVFGSQTSLSSSGVRKRNSSGAVSNPALFGKPNDVGSTQLFGTGAVSQAQQNIPFTTSVVFGQTGSAASAVTSSFPPSSSSAYTGSAQPGPQRALFGKVEDTGKSSDEKTLFGKPQSEPSKETFNRPEKSHSFGTESGGAEFSSSQHPPARLSLFPVVTKPSDDSWSKVREVPVQPKLLFGKEDETKNSGNSESTKTFGSPSKTFATEGSSQKTLFSRPVQSSSSAPFGFIQPSSGASVPKLFGKDQSSKTQGLFGKDYSSSGSTQGRSLSGLSRTASSYDLQQHEDSESHEGSPRKSLSKWNRGRDVAGPERKRKEISPSQEAESRESKISRLPRAQGEESLSPRQRISSARQSVDDMSSRTSIVMKEIPADLNRAPILRRHFSRFGTITRLQPLTTKGYANITFSNHEEARLAKNKGRYFVKGGPPLPIFWRSTSVTKSTEARPARSMTDVPRTSPKKSSAVGNVEDELASMAGTSDYQEEFLSPSPHNVEVPRREREREQEYDTRTRVSAARRRSPTPPPATSSTVMPQTQIASSQAVPDLDVVKGLLKNIHRAKAADTSERIAILDSRDKLLRLLRGRQQSDLASAKAFVGTCPDMCPEKERYYREDIRRLALYEVIPSTLTSVTGAKSKVDHYRAVKEYSRSSADQEEPLSHELRPLSVLVRTMNYLLSEVADQGGEGNWAEWYDFLWNRTRGIRKDITQQQLCDLQVAELLEKCARFHIFCSERLCEEDMMSFDAKINNENLTKCLQTLKELYADLEKKGVYCPNEAEFRAYMVLMNLNEGDILREIQQLRDEIRGSPHIRFAVKAYNALNANNYVRFFRLIEEEATFLNACALHRYFNQIRSKALLIIMKAHRAHGKNRIMYPVEEMIRLLCFEDAAEVEQFCDHYCLTVEGVDVFLDSHAYLQPEGSIPQRRSPSLVEVKRNVSVGEIINGTPLPPLELPTPFSSFDDNGVFIMSGIIQEALTSSGLYGPKPSTGSVASAAAAHEEPQTSKMAALDTGSVSASQADQTRKMEMQREKIAWSNEVVKSMARTVILEVTDTITMEVIKECVSEETARVAVINSEIDDIAKDAVQDVAKQIATEVYTEEEEKLRKKLAEDMAAQRQRVFTALAEDVVEDTVADMSKEMAKEEMRLVDAELKRQSQERCCQAYTDDLLEQTLSEMVQDIAQEVFEVDVVAKRERLEATERCVQALRCRRFFQEWRASYLRKIRVKRAMLDFPSAPSTRPTRDQIHRLVPARPESRIFHKSFFIGERAKLSVESPMDVIQEQLHLTARLSMASARQMLVNLVMWRPLDMEQTIARQLQRALLTWREGGLVEPDTQTVQWKLAVSLPSERQLNTDEETTFTKWLRAKLCKDNQRDKILETTPTYEGEVLSLYHLDTAVSTEFTVTLGLCVRCFHGGWNDTQELNILKKSILKGTSAVMFVASCAEDLAASDTTEKEATWKANKQRLHQLLKQKPKNPSLSLVIMIPRLTLGHTISVKALDDGLELSSLYQKKLLTSVHIAQPFIGSQDQPLEYCDEWTKQLTNCLRFTASKIPAPPRLRVKPVADYVEDTVVELYRAPVYQDLRTRVRHQLLHQSANTLLALYNEVVEHVAMVAASGQLTQMSWPAPEFDQHSLQGQPQAEWNTETYLCDLYELISKMRLPVFRYSDLDAEDWSAVCRDVWSYVHNLTKKDSGSAKISLFQCVAELLSHSKKTFDQFCWLASKDGPCEPTYVNMAWTDLIEACIHYRIVSLRTGHITIRKPEDDDDDLPPQKSEELEEVIVYYQEEELEDWEPPRAWLDALRDTETAEDGQLKPTVEKAADRTQETAAMEATSAQESSIEISAVSKTAQTMDRTAKTSPSSWASLRARMEQERSASEDYEKTLQSILSSPQASLAPTGRTEDASQSSDLFISPIMPAFRAEPLLSDSRSGRTSQTVQGRNIVSIHGTPLSSKTILPTKSNSGGQESLLSTSTGDMDTDPPSPPDNDDAEFLSAPTLSEKMTDLQHMLMDQKEADLLYEMRLKSFISSSSL